MPRTPDRHPGEAYEEGTIYENRSAGNDPVELGGVRLVDGDFRMLDSIGVFNPRDSSGAVAIANEELLEIDPNMVAITYAITRTAGKVTRESWTQTANGREVKRIDYVYAGRLVTSETRTVYSLADGTTIVSSKTITYTIAGNLITGWSAGAGVDTLFANEPLLEVDPNMVGVTYSFIRTSGRVISETWIRTSNGFQIKRIDYTYTGARVAGEVRKVLSLSDGVTVQAQQTRTYAYAGTRLSGYAATRDV